MNTRRRRWAKAHREIRRRGREVLVESLQARALIRLQFFATHFSKGLGFNVRGGKWVLTMWDAR